MTISGYEKGNKVPADKFFQIADALNHHVFDIDGQKFSVNRADVEIEKGGEQLHFNFSGEYASSHASVKISPGKITVEFNAAKSSPGRQR